MALNLAQIGTQLEDIKKRALQIQEGVKQFSSKSVLPADVQKTPGTQEGLERFRGLSAGELVQDDLAKKLTEALPPFEEKTIMESLAERRRLAEISKEKQKELIRSEAETALEEAEKLGKRELTTELEMRRGFATNTAAVQQLEETGRKRIREITKARDELLMKADIAGAERLEDMHIQEQLLVTQGRQAYFTNLLSLAGFETPQQERQRELQIREEERKLTGFETPEITRQRQFQFDKELALFRTQLEAAKEGGRISEEETKQRSESLGNVSFVDSILNDPSLRRATGPIQARIPGLDVGSKLVQNRIEQLKSILTLENRQKLKGQGQISDFESRMLQEAATSLERTLSHGRFLEEMYKIRGVFATAAGLESTIEISDPRTGERQIAQATREGINELIANGFTVKYVKPLPITPESPEEERSLSISASNAFDQRSLQPGIAESTIPFGF